MSHLADQSRDVYRPLIADGLPGRRRGPQLNDQRHSKSVCFPREGQEAGMGEVVQFVSKSERERMRLIREARAIYDSIFPSEAPAGRPGDEAQRS
jgi:hypothetical protein